MSTLKPDRYYLKIGQRPEREVTREEYVRAERAHGFLNTCGQPDEPATAGFTSGITRGRLAYAEEQPAEIDEVDKRLREVRYRLDGLVRMRDGLSGEYAAGFRYALQEVTAHLDAVLSIPSTVMSPTDLPLELRGDGPCGDCGTVNVPVWFTDNVLWNEVMRYAGAPPEPLLCPICFVRRVHARNLRPVAWRLIPEWRWESTEERDARHNLRDDRER